MAGAPEGNTNHTKGRLWNQAIKRALRKRSKTDQLEALDELADKLLSACDQGELTALKELGDRLDGKAAQSVAVSGDENNPLVTKIVREIVRTKD